MPRPARLAPSVIVFVLLASCAGRAPVTHRASAPPVHPGDSVIVVGRIELVPGLSLQERRLQRHDPRLENKVQAVFSDRPLDIAALSTDTLGSAAILGLGDAFMVRVPRSKHLYYLGGIVLAGTEPAPGYSGRELTFDDRVLRLPGGFVVRILPGDKAIYIGTLRYVRDSYGALRPLQVIDDYDAANAALARTFGAGTPMRDVVPLIPR